MKQFYARLLVHGYQQDLLIPAFTKGITVAHAFIKHGSVRRCVPDKEKDSTGRVFFHLTYHPRDPTSKIIQRQWRQQLLHPPWEPPLWGIKNKKQYPNWHQIDVHGIQLPQESGYYLLLPQDCPSRLIWSRDWGPILFLNQY